MQSIAYLKASDGSGNASVVTIQATRSPGATTIQGDTVQGLPDQFYGTMGTPHTFTDPITGETITVISEDTAVDFAGSVDGTNLEIDEIAPGYTDAGSAVGDIVIIRPITEYGNNLHNILSEAHEDDGSLKESAIVYDPNIFTHVASGCVITGDAYGSTRAASMTSGVVYIGGRRLTVAAVTARVYTASKDTYVDAKDNGDGTATLIYTEVANNAASPSALSNGDTFADNTHIRLGIVVTGASNIANAGSINQGEETKVLPIASSQPYQVTDSLGYLICPRDPERKIVGYRQITSNFTTTSTSNVAITGLTIPVRIPAGRKVEIALVGSDVTNDTTDSYANVGIHIGSVSGETNRLTGATFKSIGAANAPGVCNIQKEYTPSTTNPTFVASLKRIGGTTARVVATGLGDSEKGPTFLRVKLV